MRNYASFTGNWPVVPDGFESLYSRQGQSDEHAVASGTANKGANAPSVKCFWNQGASQSPTPIAFSYYGIAEPGTDRNTMKGGLQHIGGYITKTEMAARMHVTPRTIDSWMAKGLVPFRKIGRTVRFDWDEVCENLRARNQLQVTMPVRHTGRGIAEMLRQRAAEIRRSIR
jgi:excisionase family DNA binding protein